MTSVLGRTVTGALEVDEVEVWPTPGNVNLVTVEGDELQAVCPVTGQPDIYQFSIRHAGNVECESKALKMYLLGFRDVGISCAELAGRIADDLTRHLGVNVTVDLHQQTRGGMRLSAIAHGKKEPR